MDLTTLIGESAAIVDPKGENTTVTTLCGLVLWA
jgi:hypothetical protein